MIRYFGCVSLEFLPPVQPEPLQLAIGHDQVRAAVAEHHRRGIGIPGIDVGHRRHVADTQSLDAADAELSEYKTELDRFKEQVQNVE